MVIRSFSYVTITCIFIILLTGCTHVISPEMRQKTKKGLSFQKVQKNPDAFIKEIVIWGGVISEIFSRQDGTVIQVAETPLDLSEMPKDKTHSRGSFLAKTKYLDPDVYEKGRMVTLAGEIIGKELGSSGSIKYTYPIVWVKEIYLWPKWSKDRPDARPLDWDTHPDYYGR